MKQSLCIFSEARRWLLAGISGGAASEHLRSILKATIAFRQTIHISHAVFLYTHTPQSPKQHQNSVNLPVLSTHHKGNTRGNTTSCASTAAIFSTYHVTTGHTSQTGIPPETPGAALGLHGTFPQTEISDENTGKIWNCDRIPMYSNAT